MNVNEMLKYYIILIIAFAPFSVVAQKSCVDFDDFESSQNWIREVNKLDADSKIDSILERIKCERFFRKEGIEHFELISILNGFPIMFIPEYRDFLFKHIKTQNIQLLENSGNFHKNHGEKGLRLGILLIFEIDNPITDNIEALTILKVERKTKYHKRKRTKRESKIRIKLNCTKSQEFVFRIEDFSNKENNKTEKLHIEKGARTIDFSVKNEIKVITITDSEDNLITIIN